MAHHTIAMGSADEVRVPATDRNWVAVEEEGRNCCWDRGRDEYQVQVHYNRARGLDQVRYNLDLDLQGRVHYNRDQDHGRDQVHYDLGQDRGQDQDLQVQAQNLVDEEVVGDLAVDGDVEVPAVDAMDLADNLVRRIPGRRAAVAGTPVELGTAAQFHTFDLVRLHVRQSVHPTFWHSSTVASSSSTFRVHVIKAQCQYVMLKKKNEKK